MPAKKVYLIGSGKGGVGKSTLSVNIAIALAKKGKKIGLLDADLYGPSIPILMGLRRMPLETREDKFIPFYKFGIKTVSIGFLIDEDQASVWRGPLISNLLAKLLHDVEWGDLDALLIDLPPGTGDVPISLKQHTQVDGAIVVTTPQEVAVLDAWKAINAFAMLDIPLIGLIENMVGPFGKSRGSFLADRFSTNLLGSLPFLTEFQEASDEGIPPAITSPLFDPIAQIIYRNI